MSTENIVYTWCFLLETNEEYIYEMYEEGYNANKEYNAVTWELMQKILHNVQHIQSRKKKRDFNCFNFHYILSSALKFLNKLVKHFHKKNGKFCEMTYNI